MQKAHLYEAIAALNRGIDEAVRGLEQLKYAEDFGLVPGWLGEKIVLFELHRRSLNTYFCNNVERTEKRDVGRFELEHREYEKRSLDKVQVYHNLGVIEERRRTEGKPPKVRFLTEHEQLDWERQYPRPLTDAATEARETGTERP
jgi:hypothetical protein